ncbi:MAG: TolC family protein [Leptospiraceae bacterium]|nr:TolC family protein [Leptospiraceae bacterium]
MTRVIIYTFGVLILGYPRSHFAEPPPALSYTDALSAAHENSPDVRIATQDLNIAEAEKAKSDSFVPEAPSIEASVTRGTSKDSIEVLDYNYTAQTNGQKLPMKGWEVGISQKFEIAGERGLRQEEMGARKRYFEARLSNQQLQSRAQARELYLQVSLLQDWEQHLSEHLVRFYRLQARFGGGYIDRRLGSYSLVALNMGIQTLKSERDEVRTLKEKLMRELSILVGQPSSDLKLDSIDSIKMPDLPPLEELRAAMEENGVVLKEKRAFLESRVKAADLESRKLWPAPSLFLYGGERTLNSGAQITVSPANRETYMRAGIQLPLAFLGPERQNSTIERQKAEKARVELEAETSRSALQLEASYRNYESFRAQYLQMHNFLIRAERFFPALEQALMGRRITYFEFWGEHERYHSLFQKSLDVRLNAARALSELELLTGRVLEK